METLTKGSPEPFSIPLLAGYRTQQLVAGKSTLCLAWHGGEGHYQVRVYKEDNQKRKFLLIEKLVEKSEIKFKRVQLNLEKKLSEGNYRVVIRDRNGFGNPKFFDFKVVNSIVLPKWDTQKMKNSTMPMPKWAKTLHAAWLVQQENGVWRLEAYQQVYDLTNNYQPALMIRKGLEAGK